MVPKKEVNEDDSDSDVVDDQGFVSEGDDTRSLTEFDSECLDEVVDVPRVTAETDEEETRSVKRRRLLETENIQWDQEFKSEALGPIDLIDESMQVGDPAWKLTFLACLGLVPKNPDKHDTQGQQKSGNEPESDDSVEHQEIPEPEENSD